MHSSGINGEGELRGNQLTQVHLEKWPLKWCVCVCTSKCDNYNLWLKLAVSTSMFIACSTPVFIAM